MLFHNCIWVPHFTWHVFHWDQFSHFVDNTTCRWCPWSAKLARRSIGIWAGTCNMTIKIFNLHFKLFFNDFAFCRQGYHLLRLFPDVIHCPSFSDIHHHYHSVGALWKRFDSDFFFDQISTFKIWPDTHPRTPHPALERALDQTLRFWVPRSWPASLPRLLHPKPQPGYLLGQNWRKLRRWGHSKFLSHHPKNLERLMKYLGTLTMSSVFL